MKPNPKPKIVVVGSLVMDLVIWLPHLPRLNETLLPQRFESYPGGKGLNQAITARRCGAEVALVGKVGSDGFGSEFKTLLSDEGLDTSHLVTTQETGTSLGVPIILPDGNNSIIGIPRANTLLQVEEVEAAQDKIQSADILMLQNEVPVEASLAAARIAKESETTVLFNPAPAQGDLSEFLTGDTSLVDWLIPNEVEASMLSGVEVRNPESATQAAEVLLHRGGFQGVVITLGEQGVVAVTPKKKLYSPAFSVTPIDPTGAGDSFCGSFAVALAEGLKLEEAVQFGSAAGALCVTQAGAAPSLPHRSTVQALIRSANVSVS